MSTVHQKARIKRGKDDFKIRKNILWDTIARPHRKPFGLFYPLETCFSAESFHP